MIPDHLKMYVDRHPVNRDERASILDGFVGSKTYPGEGRIMFQTVGEAMLSPQKTIISYENRPKPKRKAVSFRDKLAIRFRECSSWESPPKNTNKSTVLS